MNAADKNPLPSGRGAVNGQRYNHDAKHYRFARTLDQNQGYAIEDCGGQSRVADKIVVAVSIVVVLLLMVVL